MQSSWQDVLINLFLIVGTPVLAVVGATLADAFRNLGAKWRKQTDAQTQANREGQITAAINVGIMQVLPLIEVKGWKDPEVLKRILEIATDYFKNRSVDSAAIITKAANVDKPTTATDAVKDTLSARLPDVIAQAALSPATPDVKKQEVTP